MSIINVLMDNLPTLKKFKCKQKYKLNNNEIKYLKI